MKILFLGVNADRFAPRKTGANNKDKKQQNIKHLAILTTGMRL
jgi:hypothetical protein